MPCGVALGAVAHHKRFEVMYAKMDAKPRGRGLYSYDLTGPWEFTLNEESAGDTAEWKKEVYRRWRKRVMPYLEGKMRSAPGSTGNSLKACTARTAEGEAWAHDLRSNKMST
mmetsp:Transcript_2502/g.6825  ORF Transcript_2502/g.6825 Transcript_2502/m.6825 type:complete len:112 (+) Transcript_2502:822-1157(+)